MGENKSLNRILELNRAFAFANRNRESLETDCPVSPA